MIGMIFRKPLRDFDGYAQAAEWANGNNASIRDRGDYYEVVPSELPAEMVAMFTRMKRDEFLKETDLIIIRCAEAGEPVPDEWKTYRQALRDVPAQAGFPEAVVWPNVPGKAKSNERETEDATEPAA